MKVITNFKMNIPFWSFQHCLNTFLKRLDLKLTHTQMHLHEVILMKVINRIRSRGTLLVQYVRWHRTNKHSINTQYSLICWCMIGDTCSFIWSKSSGAALICTAVCAGDRPVIWSHINVSFTLTSLADYQSWPVMSAQRWLNMTFFNLRSKSYK